MTYSGSRTALYVMFRDNCTEFRSCCITPSFQMFFRWMARTYSDDCAMLHCAVMCLFPYLGQYFATLEFNCIITESSFFEVWPSTLLSGTSVVPLSFLLLYRFYCFVTSVDRKAPQHSCSHSWMSCLPSE